MRLPSKHKLIYILKFGSVIVFVIVFSVLAPDPKTKFTYIIKNESSKNLFLVNTITGKKTLLEPESFSIDTDTKETSFNYIKNDLYKNKSYCICYADSLKVLSQDSAFKITKQINNNADWEHFDEENVLDKGGVFVCRFLIKDKDILITNK